MPAKERNFSGMTVLAAILLMMAAPADQPPTFGSWMVCVVRTAEDLAKRTREPIDAVALAALGNCQRQRNAYRAELVKNLPTGDDIGRGRVDRFLEESRNDLLELACDAAMRARYPTK